MNSIVSPKVAFCYISFKNVLKNIGISKDTVWYQGAFMKHILIFPAVFSSK